MIIIGDYEMIVSHGYTGVALDGFTILNGNWGDIYSTNYFFGGQGVQDVSSLLMPIIDTDITVEWDVHLWYITFLRRSRTRKLKGHAFTHCLTRGFT